MSAAAFLFDTFDNLDQISGEAIASWLKSPPPTSYLENYLANRILYPQVLPVTANDMEIDLAILREALKIQQTKNNNPFLDVTFRKIMIPARFLNFVPDLATLTWVFIDVLLLNRKQTDVHEDLWTVVATDDTDEIVGSIILPQFQRNDGVMTLQLLGKNYKINSGTLTVLPCPKERCEIAYKLQNGYILGKRESAVEVYGGKLGIVIDGRRI